MLMHQRRSIGSIAILQCLECDLSTEIFADRDELHLRRDNAFPGVVHLRNAMPRLSSQRRASKARKFFKSPTVLYARYLFSTLGQITVVLRQDLTSFVFLDIATPDYPIAPM